MPRRRGVAARVGLAAALVAAVVFFLRTSAVTENEFARLDAAELRHGLIAASWKGGGERRVRLAVERSDGTRYLYELDPAGRADSFPLTEGDGRYTVTVYEQTEGTRYLPRLEQSYDVTLRDPDAPFLRPSRAVWFEAGDGVAALAAEVTRGLPSDADRAAALTDYVVGRMEYDAVWAESLRTGYLPVLADVLARGGGNCLDLAALLCGLLRTAGIPARLVVGWAGEEYHAWVSPRLGGEWGHIDPTFLMSGNTEFAETPSNYRPVYVY